MGWNIVSKIIILISLWSVAACTPSSKISQLTPQLMKCQPGTPDRIQYILSNAPEGFFGRAPTAQYPWSDTQKKAIASGLAVLSDAQIQHLFLSTARAQFAIYQSYNLGESWVAGLTSTAYYPQFSLFRPTKDTGIVDQILRHEIGHALMGFAAYRGQPTDAQSYQTFNSRLRKAFTQEMAKAGRYAQNNTTEYFAEAFQTFYCSPDSHDSLNKNYPETASLLNDYLQQPVWDDHSGSGLPNSSITLYLYRRPSGKLILVTATPLDADSLKICEGTSDECSNGTAPNLSVKKLVPGQKRGLFAAEIPLQQNTQTISLSLEATANNGTTYNRNVTLTPH